MNNQDKPPCKSDLVDIRDLFNAQIAQINILINANDKGYNQRFENLIEATKAALASADRAVNKAEQASDKRFESVNEFRSALTDATNKNVLRTEFDLVVDRLEQDIKNLQLARTELIPRNEVIAMFEVMDDKFKEQAIEISKLRDYQTGASGRGKGLDDGWKYLIGIVTLIGAILGIIIFFAG